MSSTRPESGAIPLHRQTAKVHREVDGRVTLEIDGLGKARFSKAAALRLAASIAAAATPEGDNLVRAVDVIGDAVDKAHAVADKLGALFGPPPAGRRAP